MEVESVFPSNAGPKMSLSWCRGENVHPKSFDTVSTDLSQIWLIISFKMFTVANESLYYIFTNTKSEDIYLK